MIGLSGNSKSVNFCGASACATSEVLVCDGSVCSDSVCVGGACVDEPDSELLNFGPGERDHYRDVETSLIHAVGDFRELVGLGQLDMLEICAPWDSPLSQAVADNGGRSLSIGLHNGFDLKTVAGFRKALKLLRRTKPRYLHVSPPCDPWSAFQNCNQRTEAQISNLGVRRKESRKLLRHCRRLVEVQLYELNGACGWTPEDPEFHHAGGEHPLHAQSWNTPDMKAMVRMCGERFSVHGCRHGMKSKKTGRLIKKPWGWFSTHEGVRSALSMTCNHAKGTHDLIQGSITSSTAIYPPLLCKRFAKALMKDSVHLFPVFSILEQQRFSGDQHEVGFVHEHDVSGVFANEGEAPNPEDVLGEGAGDSLDDHEEPHDMGVENQPDDVLERPQRVEIDPHSDENPEENVARIKQMLRNVHRNMGHPGNEAFTRLLRDAGASEAILKEAQNFSCPECLQRGRRSPTRPSVVPKITQKWFCVSIDTFWWKTPKEALQPGEKPEYVVGLSMMDEATDYHTAILVKSGSEQPLRNISGEDFKKAFSQGWLQMFPAPALLRYDEEGFLKNLDTVAWLEKFGMKLEPVAGESAWQLGKHSRHLHTLKEQMNLLAMDVGTGMTTQEILSVCLNAKNNMHNVRGYSPNQWAFGQNHSRIGSFLQQYENLPLMTAREDWTFEENVANEEKAKRLFLEVDAKRRFNKALHTRSRPLREFTVGDLVYYYRVQPSKGRGPNNRFGGVWHGPARVLAHEKTSSYDDSQHAGSVVWIAHAGRIIRCSPEQLRHVTFDLRQADREINGPQNFHTLLEQISQQQKYLDISQDDLTFMPYDATPEEFKPHLRAWGKRPLKELRKEKCQDQEHIGDPIDHGEDRPQGPFEYERDQGRNREAGSLRNDDSGGNGPDDPPGWEGPPGPHLRRDLQGHGLQQVGSQSHHREGQSRSLHEAVRSIPASASGSRSVSDRTNSIGESRKRKPSTSLERPEHQDGRGRDDDNVSVEQGGDSGRGVGGSSSGERSNPLPHGSHRGDHGSDSPVHPEAGRPEGHLRASGRSRSPIPRLSRMVEHGMESSDLFTWFVDDHVQSDTPCEKLMDRFVHYVDHLTVVEMELALAPRDVHRKGEIWVVNAKAKKGAEVTYRKLSQEDQKLFDQAMRKELDSFLSSEAIAICTSHGVPADRIMQMRWVLTWKSGGSDEKIGGEQKKAKARLIIKGFQDPRLTTLPRESPTLSSLGRNLLLACAARSRMRLSSGDIRTAFLQGDATESQDELYGYPPPEVRQMLGMKDHEIIRIIKAIYGLLNAPKRWYDSLSRFLIDDGWIVHSLDKCLFKRIDENNEISGYLGIHVDDVLCAGVGSEFTAAINRLREKYLFGSWSCAQEGSLTYCGCEITQNDDFGIHVKQERFALGIEEIPMTTERRENSFDEITHGERRSMRQALGALNWRATQTAPWLLATVSILQGTVESATVGDLVSVNKLVRLQRKRFDQGLYFPPLMGEVTLVTFTDASWATRKDGSSQGGQITLLMEKNVLKGHRTPFCVLSWTSRRLRRVARSSTSAEAQMSANALDIHEFNKLGFWDMDHSERLDLRRADDYLSSFLSCLVCDARNIFDGIVRVETSGLHMEEKRTAIGLLAIKERLKQANVNLKWVDGDQELADGLTKPWRHEPLIKALGKGEWRIVYDPDFQSARKKRAMKMVSQNADHSYWLHCVYALESTAM